MKKIVSLNYVKLELDDIYFGSKMVKGKNGRITLVKISVFEMLK
jgi:hypothetical protein